MFLPEFGIGAESWGQRAKPHNQSMSEHLPTENFRNFSIKCSVMKVYLRRLAVVKRSEAPKVQPLRNTTVWNIINFVNHIVKLLERKSSCLLLETRPRLINRQLALQKIKAMRVPSSCCPTFFQGHSGNAVNQQHRCRDSVRIA